MLKNYNDSLQAYGRGMRAEDDYCETYILDGTSVCYSGTNSTENWCPASSRMPYRENNPLDEKKGG
jgi:Rad3-related DNA helicase